MKKAFVIAAFALVSFANAQKGTILVGGSIGMDSQKTKFAASEQKLNTFSFSPKVGYQFTDNWTAGVEAAVGTSKSESGTSELKTNGFSAGAFVRYAKPLSEIFSVYADLGAGFQSLKRTETQPLVTTTSKGDGVYVGVTPALFINFKKSFGLNFSIGGLGYETLNYDKNGGDFSHFYFNFGKTLNVGISKNF